MSKKTKKKISLFSDTDNEFYSQEACKIQSEMEIFAKDLIRKYSEKGYKIRDIHYILNSAVDIAAMMSLLDRQAYEKEKE